MKKKIVMNLQQNSREMLDVPCINTSVADTGSSSGLISERDSFIKGSYKKFDTLINVRGISGGLQVIGKGNLKMEFLDVRGRVKRITQEVFHALSVPVDFIPPQLVMRNNND